MSFYSSEIDYCGTHNIVSSSGWDRYGENNFQIFLTIRLCRDFSRYNFWDHLLNSIQYKVETILLKTIKQHFVWGTLWAGNRQGISISKYLKEEEIPCLEQVIM